MQKKDTKLQIPTIMFSLEILQKDMFPIKYQPLCFPLRVLQKRIVIRRDMFPRGK